MEESERTDSFDADHKTHLYEMDCVVIQLTVQARTRKNKDGTVRDAENVVGSRMEDLQQEEEITQHMNFERWQKQGGKVSRKDYVQTEEARVKNSQMEWLLRHRKASVSNSDSNPSVEEWSQELLRKASLGNMRPAVVSVWRQRGGVNKNVTTYLRCPPTPLGCQAICRKKHTWISEKAWS